MKTMFKRPRKIKRQQLGPGMLVRTPAWIRDDETDRKIPMREIWPDAPEVLLVLWWHGEDGTTQLVDPNGKGSIDSNVLDYPNEFVQVGLDYDSLPDWVTKAVAADPDAFFGNDVDDDGRRVNPTKAKPRKNPGGKRVPCGALSAKKCRQLQAVYESARERGASKQSAAKQAWGAVGRRANPPTHYDFNAPESVSVIWTPMHESYIVLLGDGPLEDRQVMLVEVDPDLVQDYLDDLHVGNTRRLHNGAGLGAFLGSALGVVVGMPLGVPFLSILLSSAGGAVGARYAAGEPEKKRATIAGGAGGLVGPLFAAIGGYFGGKPKKRSKNPESQIHNEKAARLAEGRSR